MRAGGWRQLQPAEVRGCQGPHLSVGEGEGNHGGAGALSDDLIGRIIGSHTNKIPR